MIKGVLNVVRRGIRLSRVALAALTVAAIWPSVARSQGSAGVSEFGQPKEAISAADFAKLRWLEGAWQATAPGQRTFYERCHFTSDSTIDLSYYSDAALTHETANGRVYLTVGRVYHTFGPNRWGATHVGTDGVFFIPQVNARNTFAWEFKSHDVWTATMRLSVTGHEQVIVYQMQRLGP